MTVEFATRIDEDGTFGLLLSDCDMVGRACIPDLRVFIQCTPVVQTMN